MGDKNPRFTEEDRSIVPPLRADLAWEQIPGDPPAWRLRDRRMGRAIRLDARGREVALRMDRVQTCEELATRIAEGGRPIEADALERVVASFSGLGLLDDDVARAAADRRAGMLLRRAASRMPLLLPEDLCFECTGCGSCCVGANIGPITPDVEEGLSGDVHDELAAAIGTTEGFFITMRPDDPDDDSPDIRICRTRNGACLFLEDDGLCAIHRRWGPQRKPHVCRLFPYQFVLTPRGIAVGLQMECRGILEASRSAPLADREDELRALLAMAETLPETRMVLSLDGESALDFDAYADLEDEVCRAVTVMDGGGWHAARIVWDTVASFAATLGRPLAEPELGGDDLRRALWAFVGDFGESLEKVQRECKVRGRHVRFHHDTLALMLEALTDAPLLADRILEDDVGECARFARLVFVNQWRGKDILTPPDLVRAVSQACLRWFLVRALAVSRARQVHRFTASAQDLVDASVAVHMLLRNRRVLPILGAMADRTVLLFGRHLGRMIDERERMRVIDKRTDFFLA